MHALTEIRNPTIDATMCRGWAWLPTHGGMYGTTFVSLCCCEIKEMFNCETEMQKMSQQYNARNSQESYSNHYSLLGEKEIRTEISSLVMKQKQISGETQKKSKHSMKYTKFMKNIFDQVLEQKITS